MEEKKDLYREKSLEYISSPEQLNDYLKVTKPAVWVVLVAVVVLLVGIIVWSYFAYITSFVSGIGDVEDGIMVIEFDDKDLAVNVHEGMIASVGEIESEIDAISHDEDGTVFAVASTELDDGAYDVRVNYKKTQVVSLLLGN